MNLLQDKVALVTGAANGIGRATAELFAAQGAHVYLADVDAPGVERAAEAIRSAGGDARGFAADVRKASELARPVQDAESRFGRLDILVNNAGIYPRRSFLEMTEEEWDLIQDVNVKGMFHATKLALPLMVKHGYGKVVNISSVTFFYGRENLTHYVASKGAIIGFTRSLAREVGGQGVWVNCITPGAVLVETEKLVNTPEQIRALVEAQSLKRRLLPIDVARVCLFLASELSDGMTGQTVNVDAGRLMH